jgi:hypothetical protein
MLRLTLWHLQSQADCRGRGFSLFLSAAGSLRTVSNRPVRHEAERWSLGGFRGPARAAKALGASGGASWRLGWRVILGGRKAAEVLLGENRYG